MTGPAAGYLIRIELRRRGRHLAVLGLLVAVVVERAVMGSVSLPFSPSLPVAAVVLVPIAVVVLAQLVASSSRRAAGRTPAAAVLRTE